MVIVTNYTYSAGVNYTTKSIVTNPTIAILTSDLKSRVGIVALPVITYLFIVYLAVDWFGTSPSTGGFSSSKCPAPLDTGREEAPEAAREGFGEVPATATFPAAGSTSGWEVGRADRNFRGGD